MQLLQRRHFCWGQSKVLNTVFMREPWMRIEGSVATLELRRNLAIASAKLDRHLVEQTKNEAVE